MLKYTTCRKHALSVHKVVEKNPLFVTLTKTSKFTTVMCYKWFVTGEVIDTGVSAIFGFR